MRNTVAKRIRKEAAKTALRWRVPSVLNKVYEGFKRITLSNGREEDINTETVRYSGFRRIYKDMKKAYIRGNLL